MTPLFSCSQCGSRFSVEDVKHGNFFPSTGVCVECYKKRSNNKSECFGKKYDAKSLACSMECQDSVLCKAFVHYPDQFQRRKHVG